MAHNLTRSVLNDSLWSDMKRREFVKFSLALTGTGAGLPALAKALGAEGSVIETGYSPFDELTGGLRTGELCVVAGDLTDWKSTFLDEVIVNNITRKGVKVVYLRGDDCNVKKLPRDKNIEYCSGLPVLESDYILKEIDLRIQLLSTHAKTYPYVLKDEGMTPDVAVCKSELDSAPILYGDASNDIAELYETVRDARDYYGVRLFAIRDMKLSQYSTSPGIAEKLSQLARDLDMALVVSTNISTKYRNGVMLPYINGVNGPHLDKDEFLSDALKHGLTLCMDKLVFVDGGGIGFLKPDGYYAEFPELIITRNVSGGTGIVVWENYAFNNFAGEFGLETGTLPT